MFYLQCYYLVMVNGYSCLLVCISCLERQIVSKRMADFYLGPSNEGSFFFWLFPVFAVFFQQVEKTMVKTGKTVLEKIGFGHV